MKTIAGLFSISLLFASMPIQAQVPALENIHKFSGHFFPTKLLQGSDGNFYGTTQEQAMGGGNYEYTGSIFKIAPDGTFTTLVAFVGTNGLVPTSLLEAPDGNFYGTTDEGGLHNKGTLFQVTPTGTLTTLAHLNHVSSFTYTHTLTLGSDGDLYGSMGSGASLASASPHSNLLFRVTTGGSFIWSVDFPSSAEYFPGKLTEGPDGNFYGIASGMKTTAEGKFFRVAPDGTITLLADLPGGEGVLTLGSDGDFYGTTRAGGTQTKGSIFKATTMGVITTLVSFNDLNGSWPAGGLMEGSDGNFYGSTFSGSVPIPSTSYFRNHEGTLFSMTPAGVLTIIARFDSFTASGPGAGCRPMGASPTGVVSDADGALWGTTANGGTKDEGGTVFRFGLPRPELVIVENPSSQSVDTTQTLTLKVVAKSKRPATYQWLKNGKVIANSKTVVGAKSSTLKLSNIKRTDAGAFSVVVTTAKAKERSTSAVVKVNITDADGDRVGDDLDLYPGTAAGTVVNKQGASISQLVPASGPLTGGAWKSRTQYVTALTKVANTFRLAKLITAKESSALIGAASAAGIALKS